MSSVGKMKRNEIFQLAVLDPRSLQPDRTFIGRRPCGLKPLESRAGTRPGRLRRHHRPFRRQ